MKPNIRKCRDLVYKMELLLKSKIIFLSYPYHFTENSLSQSDQKRSYFKTFFIQRKEEIFWAISQLSRNQAAAVLMRFIQELPYGEIALALGCAESTARRHIARAKGRLYKLLSPVLSESGEEVKK